MKSWEAIAACADCGNQKIARKKEIREDYRCRSCHGKRRGVIMGELYGKTQTKTPRYCSVCNVFVQYSVRVKRCAPCHTAFMSNRFTGESNPAWKGERKRVCECGAKKGFYAKECRECSFASGTRSGENNGRYDHTIDREYKKECQTAAQRMGTIMRNSCSISGFKKNYAKTKDLLGYTWEDFKEHIEKQMTPDMSWDRRIGKPWHIDHIIPVNWFMKNRCFDIKIVNCLKNLRPLDRAENIRKSDKCDMSIEEVEIFLGVKLVLGDKESNKK